MNERDIAVQIARLERKINRLKFPEAYNDIASPLLSLPMLRACWLGCNATSWMDSSGNDSDLSKNGTPYYTQASDGLIGTWVLDGAGDWFHHVTSSTYEVTGLESYVFADYRGLTLMGWFYAINLPGVTAGLLAKWLVAGNQRSYAMWINNAGQLGFTISDDGTGGAHIQNRGSTNTIGTGEWFFACGRWDADNMAVFLGTESDGLVKASAASTLASINNGTADFTAGGYSGGVQLLHGALSYSAICAMSVTDQKISSVFEQMRPAFRV